MNREVWEKHLQFHQDRQSLRLMQSPHSITSLLHGEVQETIDAYKHFLKVTEHNGDIHELLFELADVFIYSMSLAHQLKRDDLAEPVLSHLYAGDSPLHKELDILSLDDRISLLIERSAALKSYIQNTPDQEMGPDDEIFTQSIVHMAATAGSIARAVLPTVPFELYVAKKIDYNNKRYRRNDFLFPDADKRILYGPAVSNAYEEGHSKGKRREGHIAKPSIA